MEEKYSISELSELLGITIQAVWKKVKRFSLTMVKEVVNNRLTTLVILNEEDKIKLFSSLQVNQLSEPVQQPVYNEVKQQFNEPVNQQFNNQDYKEILQRVEQLALKAGKYELLEDKSKELKDDVKYWQDKYFEVARENERLKARVEQLDVKPWWRLK